MRERERRKAVCPANTTQREWTAIDLQPQMTAENSAIIMTNERKGHRMEEGNVNTSSPKKGSPRSQG